MLCAYTRPRYQVSVYRTIGPLVLIFFERGPQSEISSIFTLQLNLSIKCASFYSNINTPFDKMHNMQIMIYK